MVRINAVLGPPPSLPGKTYSGVWNYEGDQGAFTFSFYPGNCRV